MLREQVILLFHRYNRLQAAEIDAEVILLAKTVDGVYVRPGIKSEHKFDRLDYLDVLRLALKVINFTTSLCMDNGIPIIVF